jgi:hypothetical protein
MTLLCQPLPDVFHVEVGISVPNDSIHFGSL